MFLFCFILIQFFPFQNRSRPYKTRRSVCQWNIGRLVEFFQTSLIIHSGLFRTTWRWRSCNRNRWIAVWQAEVWERGEGPWGRLGARRCWKGYWPHISKRRDKPWHCYFGTNFVKKYPSWFHRLLRFMEGLWQSLVRYFIYCILLIYAYIFFFASFREYCESAHFTVNHSLEFVNTVTGACTNEIEGCWTLSKMHCPNFNRHRAHFDGTA